ncbi:MAG: hypothetical protein IJF40_00015, partial [Clostridia bacterium]|nr:hypothetical protein [Clostridia bacterium]
DFFEFFLLLAVWERKLRLGYIYNVGKFHLRFKKTCFFPLADENKTTAGTEIRVSISAVW